MSDLSKEKAKETVEKLTKLDEKDLISIDGIITALIMRQQLEEKNIKEKAGV